MRYESKLDIRKKKKKYERELEEDEEDQKQAFYEKKTL